MSSPKCHHCGLVNFASAPECKRCGAVFESAGVEHFSGRANVQHESETGGTGERSLLRRVVAGFAAAGFLLFVAYISLLQSSAAATYEERQTINRAVDIIEQAGFSKDAFLLRHFANYRTSDNWWNNYVGHGDAYAATNFPFEVVTLYPDFFNQSADDIERAVILMHEARHLAGAGEEEAFATTWRDKTRLGYTRARYGHSRVWQNIAEFTFKYAPEQFSCGTDGRQDCSEIVSLPQK